MYAETFPLEYSEMNIELVQNSGIQFLDFEAELDWRDKDRQSIARQIAMGYFIRVSASLDEPLVRLEPRTSSESEVEYFDPINKRFVDAEVDAAYQIPITDSLRLYDGIWFPIPMLPEYINGACYGPTNWARARIVRVTDDNPNTGDSEIMTEFPSDSSANKPKPKRLAPEEAAASQAAIIANNFRERYRIVLAFDTKTQDAEANLSYLAPTNTDVESGIRFCLASEADKCHDFLKGQMNGLPWVLDWAKSVYTDLYKERVKPRFTDQDMAEELQERLYEAHYLNVLAFIAHVVQPRPVHFISNQLKSSYYNGNKVVDVSLILDIGNASSCGIMVEDHPNVTRSDDDFNNTYTLCLRDLNAPEMVYTRPFASRIEFAAANFDYDNNSARSGRPDAFSWPSMVRVGAEAENLLAFRHGNEGNTGLTSPKRYIWNTDGLVNDEWVFNTCSYQIRSAVVRKRLQSNQDRAFLSSVGTFFNSEGKALFALSKDDTSAYNLASHYSPNSTMTFMLIEIFLQAIVQMNSLTQRLKCDSSNAPRRLKAIIITTPPGMPAEERELYRGCVYQALGILWKSLGFDTSSPLEFAFAQTLPSASATTNGTQSLRDMESEPNPNFLLPIPDVYLDWNEAEAGQVVYIYNENQKTFKGNNKAFIASLRRPSFAATEPRLGEVLVDGDGNSLLSARIASVDIGGGTTDIVVKDYSFKRNGANHEDDIIPREVFKDGFKVAGDDLVHDIIRDYILTQLAKCIKDRGNGAYKDALSRLVGDTNMGDVRMEYRRKQFTQQILTKVAYKVLYYMEHLDPNTNDLIVEGPLGAFLDDKEMVKPALPRPIKRLGKFPRPSLELLTYVDKVIGEYIPNFRILNLGLRFNIAQIHRTLVRGEGFSLTRILRKICEVLSTFDCDLVLLTGRTSKLPAIRSFFLQRLNVPSSRVIAMHKYRCSGWYPFGLDSSGECIGDPKTTASVGALLYYLRFKHNKLPNFRFYAKPDACSNTAHYMGIIDNANMIKEEAVLYKYESAALIAKRDSTNAEDEESNFVPYKRESEEFKTKLAVEFGYRLLDDPNFETTPIFKLEAFADIEDTLPIKKVRALDYDENLSPESVQELLDKVELEVRESFEARINELLQTYNANVNTNFEQQKSLFEQELMQRLQAEALQRFPEPSGLLSGLTGKKAKVQVDRQSFVSENYMLRYPTEVTARLESLHSGIENVDMQLKTLLNEMLEENIKAAKAKHLRKFKKLETLLNENRVPFFVTLRKVNKSSPYPLEFIRKNLPNLKRVESFDLERVVSEDGTDYTPYFRLHLKTISGAKVKYFMDSGSFNVDKISV